MKTPFDLLRILYELLFNSSLKAQLSGDVYKHSRPAKSKKEDVVINSLPVSGDQIQLGTANVNVYVPNLTIELLGESQSVADNARLEYLTSLALPVLQERYEVNTGGHYTFRLSGIHVIEEPETNMHYVNLRVDFQFFPN